MSEAADKNRSDNHTVRAAGHEPVAAAARRRFAVTEEAASYQTAAPSSREAEEATIVQGTAAEPLSVAGAATADTQVQVWVAAVLWPERPTYLLLGVS